ncbi:MAG: AraC family transcriptional regulator [Prolixibacteraceae bacterium]|nr:AraC family transcriptional regulator [Prolixibacteraceae bacterium]
MQHTPSSEIRYITFHEKDDSWRLKVNTVGFESIPVYSAYPTSGHPQGYSFDFERGRVLQEFQLVYITKGKGQFASGHAPAGEVPEGSVFVLFPNEWHTYRPSEISGWESYWVGFSGSFADGLLAGNQLLKNSPVLNIGYDEEIVSLYKKLLEVSNSERPGYQQLLSGIVIHLLAYVFYRERDKNWKDKEVLAKIDKARLIIREKINTPVSPEELAASLNMSYTWFRRMFRQYTGLAPAQYIAQLKMQKAKELLTRSDKTVKEIALELGFESIDYFSTAFRKQTGQTPTQFRWMCQGKPDN